MKCPNCGGQMGLEDAFCPYCNTPNAMAAQHQSDMARFRREYETTQQDVMQKTSFVRQHGSWLVVVSVLLVALIGGIVLHVSAWDIGYSIREDSLKSTAAEDYAMLDSYLEQGEYGKFVGYYDANGLSMGEHESYLAVETAASAYVDILQHISSIGNSGDWAFRPEHISDTCAYLAEDFERIYLVEQRYSYGLDQYLPDDKKPYLEDIRERTGLIAQTYFGFTKQDVENIPDMSKRKLAQLIEEGVKA